jgi:hypothetical protein
MANEKPSQEVAVTHIDPSIDRMGQFHEFMRQRAVAERTAVGNVAQQISARNADQIFAAVEKDDGTDEDIWNAGTGGALQGRDAVNEDGGLEIRIYGFRPDESTRTFEGEDEETRKGYYVTIDAMVIGGPDSLLRTRGLEIGQEIALQTGADDVIFRLRAFELRSQKTGRSAFPLDARLVGVKTSKDNTILKLRPLNRRAQAGTVQP